MSSPKNRKILIIDDNQEIREDYRKILTDQRNETLDLLEREIFQEEIIPSAVPLNFELDFASQGEEGYKKVVASIEEKKPYAVVFVDIRMPPGWDGVKTAQMMLSVDPDLEIVFSSAHSDFSLHDIHRELGSKDDFMVIKKPFEVIEVKQAAIALSDKWNLNEALKGRIEVFEKQLVMADKLSSLGQLAAGVAHEINNPIGYINSNLGTLKKYTEHLLELITRYQSLEQHMNQEAPEFKAIEAYKLELDLNFLRKDLFCLIEESCEGVTRVKKIVCDLKDFSRPSDKVWDNFDLHAGIESTLNIAKAELKNKVNIVKEYGSIPTIQAVGSQINQVILNLLINASHAIEGTGTITLQTQKEKDNVILKVIDSGKGINSKDLDKIFDPFFSTKPVGVGTGLGLSLSYGIIQSHHGKISVESKEGSGTTFTIELPIEQPEIGLESIQYKAS